MFSKRCTRNRKLCIEKYLNISRSAVNFMILIRNCLARESIYFTRAYETYIFLSFLFHLYSIGACADINHVTYNRLEMSQRALKLGGGGGGVVMCVSVCL